MVWRIELTATAAKRLAKLDKGEAKRITSFLRQRLAVLDDPRTTGKALTGPHLGAYWRYRVGDYRIILETAVGRA
ncbi:type II toxin-antitoxin system RelE family toxin, partial [Sulfuriferula plumbiphila]|uniref:type II toxin-antitoxin system RelE family toxin n=1 Tax=Sulfuriferula plumbiphila TaxID=171865 RepID=UPI0011BD8C48